MKIPKTMRIMGYEWKITVDKNKAGGSFDCGKKEIIVGSADGEEEETLLHELMEAILAMLNMRFVGPEGSMEYRFFMTHTDFVNFHHVLYQAFKDNKIL